jgi:hypothetical protein
MRNTNSIKSKYPLVIHPFGDVWAVWFKKSQSFLLLAEPAFEILQFVTEGKSKTAIRNEIRNKYGHSESDTNTFVDEIIQHINQYNSSKTYIKVSKKKEAKIEFESVDFNFSKNYQFGNTVLTIDYDDEWMQHLIHPSFMHLETTEQSVQKHHIRCYRTKKLLILTYNNKIVESFDFEAIEYFKGAVSQLIYSIIYKKPFSGWMCTLHASGVHFNNKAFVFSAAAGSGKSTTSAILKASGLEYISDDFIAATPDGNVYPFPASISVKEGSFAVLSKYYPELSDKVLEKAATGKMVRYLPVNNFSEDIKNGIPVTGFVFVEYQPESSFALNNVSKKEAIQLLLKETWVNPKTEFVTAFFEWIGKTNFYRMTYSNNEIMINAITNLLKNEEQNSSV